MVTMPHSHWSEDDASSSDMLEKQEFEKMTNTRNTPAQAPPKRGGKLPKHITDTLKAWLLERIIPTPQKMKSAHFAIIQAWTFARSLIGL